VSKDELEPYQLELINKPWKDEIKHRDYLNLKGIKLEEVEEKRIRCMYEDYTGNEKKKFKRKLRKKDLKRKSKGEDSFNKWKKNKKGVKKENIHI